MATRKISTKLAIEGEAQYRQALQSINSSLSTLNSQLKLTKSEFQNHQNSLQALQAKDKALADVQDALAKKVQACKDAYANAQRAMAEYQQKAETNRTALEKVKAAMDGMDSSTKKSGQQWLEYKTKIEQAEARLKELERTSGDTSEEEAKLRKEIEQARAAMDKLEAETGGAAKTAGELLQQQKKLNLELDSAEAGYSACERSCESWQKQENNAKVQLNNVNAELELNRKYLKEAETATDGCAQSIDEFGNKTKDTGKATEGLYNLLAGAGLIQAIRGVATAFKECVDAASEFEAQMSTVEAISGATQDEMTALSELAKEMGATTKFTAQEAGQGLEYMAMAGWKADDMLDGLAGVMNLAAAAGEDLAQTSDIVTDALTAFGLSASDSAHFSDVLAQASANSNTNVSMMGNSFKMVATTAGGLNYSIDDVAVALGAMANQGLKGEMAGTALATAFTRMAGTNEKASAAMEQLGLTMFDSQGNAKELSVFLNELRDAFSGMNQQQVVSYAYMLAGQKGMKGLQAIVNTSEADWNKLTEAIAGSSGAAKRMAETKLDNFKGQVTLLESAADGLKVEIGSQLTPVLGKLAEAATEAFNWLTDVAKDCPGLIDGLFGAAAAITALVAIMGTAKVIIPAVTAAWTALTTAFKANSIGATITLIATLVAGLAAAVGAAKAHAEAQMVETNAAKKLNEELEEQAKSYEEIKAKNEEAATSTKALANSVIDLAKSASTSQLDHEALLDTIERLNEAVPGLNLAYDEQAGALNQTTEAILAQVDAQNQLNESNAEIDHYNELLQEQEAIKLKIKDADTAATEAQNKLNEAEGLSRSEKKRLNQIIKDNNGALEIYNGQLADVTAQIEEMRPHAEALMQSLNETSGVCDQASVVAQNLANGLVDLQTAYDEAYDSALDSIQGQAALWEKLDQVTAMSIEDIQAGIQSQIEYWNSYTENLENLYGRNIEGMDRLVAKIDDGSEKSKAAIAGLAAATDEEITKTIAMMDELGEGQIEAANTFGLAASGYATHAQVLFDSVKATLADPSMSEAAKQLAYDMLEGLAMGIDETGEEVDEATQRAAQELIATFKGELESNSPSKVFERIGQDTMAGYIIGVNGKDSSTQSALQSLAQRAIAAFRGISNSSTLNGTGSQTVQGYISGSNSQSGNAQSTLRTLAQGAINAFNGVSNGNTLRNSGSQTVSGYVSGVNSQSGQATNTMWNLANNAVNAVKNNSTSSSLYNAGSQTIQGYIDGVNSRSGGLYSTLASIASSAIARFKSILGIRSPSRVFAEMGAFTGEGYIEGVEGQRHDIIGTMESMAKQASDSFRSRLDLGLDDVNAAMYGYQTPFFGGAFSTTDPGLAPKQDNSGALTSAIIKLSDRIDDMGSIKDLELRLDTNRLVGGIASKMDSALASRRGLAERGVT